MALLNEIEPDRFQKLAQALLVAELPGVRCFPVGQADGGRDATSTARGEAEFVCYQVKSSRNPEEIRDKAQWLIDAIDGELAKITELHSRGMIGFYLITNVRGTSKLDSGTMDRVETYMTNSLPVPGECWWFDDIERRLESHPTITWHYPEVLKGTDIIARLFESDLTEQRQRRERAFRLFITAQAEADATLKFKQTDLYGSIFDLYVDVDSVLNDERRHHGARSRAEASISRFSGPWSKSEFEHVIYYESPNGRLVAFARMPIARLVLELAPVADDVLMVLEGGPGQGKSTVGQYVCQVHRVRLLAQSELLHGLTESHVTSPLRLPLRVDLRDVATWLRGSPGEDLPNRSLEAFFAQLIQKGSGGIAFDVEDLHAVIKERDVLLVLDGLDEVADIEARAEVVRETDLAIQRLRQSTKSLHALVTSRPAAFANSPGFDHDRYTYVTLMPLKVPQIKSYAEKWVTAKRLDTSHAREVQGTLTAKLSEPHIHKLARNPMQLAILLSLISSKGSALPDKRTAMYDDYVDVFFSRESEKTALVRENRDLLIDIHGLVAWELHSSAELGNTAGNISQSDLIALVRRYLQSEGRPTDLAEELFKGAVERVVALVSRIEGTYEFEVQPLREYFSARYLYHNAPFSRIGNEQSDSKPDRFDALARNPYWLNVARFYAGAYTKGELGGLADAIQELWSGSELRATSQPRILTMMLLVDYVFSQSPPAMRRVIELLLDQLGTRHCMGGEVDGGIVARLPDDGGRTNLVNKALDLLEAGSQSRDRVGALIAVALANASGPELAKLWLERSKPHQGDRSFESWVEIGSSLGIYAHLQPPEVDRLFADYPERVYRLVEAGRNRHYESSATDARRAFDLVGSFRVMHPEIAPTSGCAEVVSAATWHIREGCRIRLSDPEFAASRLRGTLMPGYDWPEWEPSHGQDYGVRCKRLGQVVTEVGKGWVTSHDDWADVMATLESLYPDGAPLLTGVSLVAARSVAESVGMEGWTPHGAAFRRLWLERRSVRSWAEAFNSTDSFGVVAAYFCFATARVLRRFQDEAEGYLQSLDQDGFADLWRAVRFASIGPRSSNIDPRGRNVSDPLSHRYAACIHPRMSDEGFLTVAGLVVPPSGNGDGYPELIADLRARQSDRTLETWAEALPMMKSSSRMIFQSQVVRLSQQPMPASLAREVVDSPASYPLWVVERAEDMLRDSYARDAPKLGQVADRNGWFAEG